MFEAVVNRQFKSYFSGVHGSVNMGAISVLRRIFNGHKIDGYVLVDNIKNQLVLIKKKDFELLCEYIKVELERTSNIPRANIEKQRGIKCINMGMGNILPYRLVSYREYINFLNTEYLYTIQEYQYMIVKYMNFSHFEVIYKAMNSEMRDYILKMYNLDGEKINKCLSNRVFNAEEYEVLLLALANVGVEELDFESFKYLCAIKDMGAKGLRTKLAQLMEKYKREKLKLETDNLNKFKNIDKKGNEVEAQEKVEGYNFYNPFWYLKLLKKYPEKFKDIKKHQQRYTTFTYIFNGEKIPLEVGIIKDGRTRFMDREYKLTACVHSRETLEGLSESDCDQKIIDGCDYISDAYLKENKLYNVDNYEDWYITYLVNLYKDVQIGEGVIILNLKNLHDIIQIKVKNENKGLENELIIFSDLIDEFESFTYKIDNTVDKKVIIRWGRGLSEKIRIMERKVKEFNKVNKSENNTFMSVMIKDNEEKIKELNEEMDDLCEKIEDLEVKIKNKDSYYGMIDCFASLEDVIVQKVIEDRHNYVSFIFSYPEEDYFSSDLDISLYLVTIKNEYSLGLSFINMSSYLRGGTELIRTINEEGKVDKLLFRELMQQFEDENGTAGTMPESELIRTYDWYCPYDAKDRLEELEKIYREKEEELEKLEGKTEKMKRSTIKKSNPMRKKLSESEIKDALEELGKLFPFPL